MRRVIVLIAIMVTMVQGVAAPPPLVAPAADPSFVHVYHYGVGHGDCTMIVACDRTNSAKPVTKCVIIDCGGTSMVNMKNLWNSMRADLDESLKNVAGAEKLVTHFVVSHLHNDHARNIVTLCSLIHHEKRGPKMKLITRLFDGKKWPWFRRYTQIGTDPKDFYERCTTSVKTIKANSYATPEDVRAGDYLINETAIKMRCVAANGCVLANPGDPADVDPISALRAVGSNGGSNNPRNENDLSFAWILEIGKARYFTGGDLSGTTSGHWDIEGWLKDRFVNSTGVTYGTVPSRHFCAFKVSHHGSLTSTNQDFTTYFMPRAGVISAKMRKFDGDPTTHVGLPEEDVIDRLSKAKYPAATPNLACEIFYTYIPATGDPNPPDCYHPNYFRRTVKSKNSQTTSYRDIIITFGKTLDDDTELGVNPSVTMRIGKRLRNKDKLAYPTPPQAIQWSDVQCNRH